jgi:hypothetical protein
MKSRIDRLAAIIDMRVAYEAMITKPASTREFWSSKSLPPKCTRKRFHEFCGKSKDAVKDDLIWMIRKYDWLRHEIELALAEMEAAP